MAEDDIVSATGLALATIANLVERPEPVPKGEIGRCLTLLAKTACRSYEGCSPEEWLRSWGCGANQLRPEVSSDEHP